MLKEKIKELKFVGYIQLAYILALILMTFFLKIVWLPDILFLMIGFGFFLTGSALKYVRDFFPFIIFLLSYDTLRGFADNLNSRVVSTSIINLEKAIFGQIPTISLQKFLYRPGSLSWYDFLFILTYCAHFFVPFLMALWLWKVKYKLFREYTHVLLTVSYLAFLTFLLMPVMPPWMAYERGLLPLGEKIMQDFADQLKLTAMYSVYFALNPNPVAAFPSLHTAYPLIVSLFLIRGYGRLGYLSLLYPLVTALGLVYFAEHYVVDVLGGIIYTLMAYFLITRFASLKRLFFLKLRRSFPEEQKAGISN